MNTRTISILTAFALAAMTTAARAAQPENDNPRAGAPPTGDTRTANPPHSTSFLQAAGFPSVHQQVPSDQLLMSEARSIRRALNHNAATAHEPIEVVLINGRIVLRGTASSDAARRAVEKTADDAISQPDHIASQVRVQHR